MEQEGYSRIGWGSARHDVTRNRRFRLRIAPDLAVQRKRHHQSSKKKIRNITQSALPTMTRQSGPRAPTALTGGADRQPPEAQVWSPEGGSEGQDPAGGRAARGVWRARQEGPTCLQSSVARTSLLESPDSDGLRRACAGRQPDLRTAYGPGLGSGACAGRQPDLRTGYGPGSGRGPDSTPSPGPDSDRSDGADIP